MGGTGTDTLASTSSGVTLDFLQANALEGIEIIELTGTGNTVHVAPPKDVEKLRNFTVGAGGDVLDLGGLLESVGAPQDGTAFSEGWLEFSDSTAGTEIMFDADGAGPDYAAVSVLTLLGVQMDQADTDNYVL